MIFLGAFGLLGFRSLTASPSWPSSAMSVGERAWVVPSPDTSAHDFSPLALAFDTSSFMPSPTGSVRSAPLPVLPQVGSLSSGSGPDYERIIGRTFAWACTVLYLTSRLPQIWKNYRRRSVEGLSIWLFVMAALGNSLYVASILTSPEANGPHSTRWLKEEVPYLLGSGGTLCFDFTIFLQSRIFRHPRRKRHSRRSSTAALVGHPEGFGPDGEEAALLYTEPEEEAGDLEAPTETGRSGKAPSSKSRSRTRSGGLARGTSISLTRSRVLEPEPRPEGADKTQEDEER